MNGRLRFVSSKVLSTVSRCFRTSTRRIPRLYIYQRYNPNGGVFQGGDDMMTELTNKAKAEFDNDARKQLVYEMQRHEGKAMNFPFSHGGSSNFVLNWPCVRN